jgi:hypothetical protein
VQRGRARLIVGTDVSEPTRLPRHQRGILFGGLVCRDGVA